MHASAGQGRAAAQRLEAAGYPSVFTGEVVGGKDVMVQAAVLLAATRSLVVGSGIANVWARRPGTMYGAAATLGDALPGRFVLGLGVSHAVLVENTGQTYAKPFAHMSRYLHDMDAFAAEPPTAAGVRLLAALRPRMLGLAGDRADGALPYFVPVAHTSLARNILGPDKLLVPEQAVVLTTDRQEGMARARHHVAGYLRLPNYVNNLRELGYSDEDLEEPGSDRLVADMVAVGDEDAIRARIDAHLETGADHVRIQPLGDLDSAVRQAQALAARVL